MARGPNWAGEKRAFVLKVEPSEKLCGLLFEVYGGVQTVHDRLVELVENDPDLESSLEAKLADRVFEKDEKAIRAVDPGSIARMLGMSSGEVIVAIGRYDEQNSPKLTPLFYGTGDPDDD